MAFDHAGFFAIVGKYVKPIDIYDGYLDAVETHKGAIQDILETENLPDLYPSLPPLFEGMQANITSWIEALNRDLENLFLDRTYTIEEIPSDDHTVNGMLLALFDHMAVNNITIKTSVVSLGGADVDEASGGVTSGFPGTIYPDSTPRLFCSRKLDGVSAPGNGVVAHKRYAGVESQLARSTTMHAEIITNTTGAESAQLYSLAPETGPYLLEDEEPGLGPVLTTAEGINLIPSNPKFNSWNVNSPNGWVVSGGAAGTDYLDSSGTGLGPFRAKIANIKISQQLTGLNRNKMYFAAVDFYVLGLDAEVGTVQIKVRNLADTQDYMTARTKSVTQLGIPDAGNTSAIVHGQAFGFFYLDDDDDLNNVYVEIKTNAVPATNDIIEIRKAVVCEAQYYNGLACAWWAPVERVGTYVFNQLNLISKLVVSNNDAGVFQRYFRKSWNIQLPTADVPSIADALAT